MDRQFWGRLRAVRAASRPGRGSWIVVGALLLGLCPGSVRAQSVGIFSNSRIGFGNGQNREIQQTVTFPEFGANDKLTFNWDILGDQDPWDRAGSIHLNLPGGKQVQLGKFVTGFNGTTSHSQDISDLSALLSGRTLTVEAHIDTWVADAWRLNASVQVDQDAQAEPNPDWATVAIPRDAGLGWNESGDVSRTYNLAAPSKIENAKLTYFASGHHHTQTSASDEFNQRRHHLYVDGEEVWTGIPWRTDGYRFRSVNPTSGRWDGNGNGDGDTDDRYPIDTWSSDFPRSGWVPGDEVTPYEIDISQWVAGGGRHQLRLMIEDVDINSFWRVSAWVSGSYYPTPELPGDFNEDGVVDAADYTVWRDEVTYPTGSTMADATADGVVDQWDYLAWRAAYGERLNGTSAAAVPEPGSCGLLTLVGLLAAVRRLRD
ncbi:hypothetical protein Pla123a_12460 [Posidoniimonas polymericola]|uniref:Peptide-N-glycosidase F N-terminal domain-containing protein n=1 Tax=Posidoniimonas polymericola TaxID=2528002 RepID=A0A5C5YTW9_9BACT|nr:peptide-N-glycosidase F-related protein [Posidoniimonas polymericola]TWT78454.1 hypothetical protein Pla123a_12460 [Posidoniimonas polymericola]